jgi:hypothetical protein
MLPLNQAINQALSTSTGTGSNNPGSLQKNLTSSEALDLERFQLARASTFFKDVSMAMAFELLLGGMYKLGVKPEKAPNDHDLALMQAAIVEEYPNIKIGEIGLAFDLASKGKLDMDAETYQNFSMLYLHRILRAFARYAIVKLNEIKPVQQEQRSHQIVTDREKLEIAWDCYKKFRKWDSIVFGLDVFKILYKEGKIVVTPAATLQKVTSAMNDQMITGSSRRKAEIAGLLNDDDYMENQCKRMAVANYFDTFLKTDKNK